MMRSRRVSFRVASVGEALKSNDGERISRGVVTEDGVGRGEGVFGVLATTATLLNDLEVESDATVAIGEVVGVVRKEFGVAR